MTLFSTKQIFVIAEMANSHEGDISKAIETVEEASKVGANAIKFQKFQAIDLLSKNHPQFELFKGFEMSNKHWQKLVKYAKAKKLRVLFDVFDISSAKQLLKMNVDGLKIHSTDISNPYLLEFLSKIDIPILISTAGCKLNEIDQVIKILMKTPKEIALMHGFQGFPTKLEDTNLLRITELRKKYDFPIGIMDHVAGQSKMALIVPLLGISQGATIVEKHITLDRTKKGIDYYSSLEGTEFKELIKLIRKTEVCLGSSSFSLGTNEVKYRLSNKKNIVAKKTIKKGTKFNKNLFDFKRTKQKIESTYFFDLDGKTSKKDIKKGTIITSTQFPQNKNKIAAVVACRVYSERLYAKPLQKIGRLTILEHSLRQLRTSKFIDEIVLAISKKQGNEIFVNFAKKNEIKFVVGDDVDVLQRLIDGAKYVDAKIVFRVTSENPYLYWEGIDSLIESHLKGKHDFSYIEDLPIGSGFEVINLNALEKSHFHGLKKHRSELCSLYIFEHKNKFKINNQKPPKQLQKPNIRLTVDTPEDLLVARNIYHSLATKNKPISLFKIITLLEKNPDILQTNSKIPLGVTRIWE